MSILQMSRSNSQKSKSLKGKHSKPAAKGANRDRGLVTLAHMTAGHIAEIKESQRRGKT